MRDIAHEQISRSSTEELITRKYDLQWERARLGGLPRHLLAELHRIESELHCRRTGISSEPWVTHTGRGA